jgi:hypothetical protein
VSPGSASRGWTPKSASEWAWAGAIMLLLDVGLMFTVLLGRRAYVLALFGGGLAVFHVFFFRSLREWLRARPHV